MNESDEVLYHLVDKLLSHEGVYVIHLREVIKKMQDIFVTIVSCYHVNEIKVNSFI